MNDIKTENNESNNNNDIQQYINLKLYSLPYVNDYGYRIGNYHVKIDTTRSPLPFSTFDQVDHFLVNLFNYAKEVPNNKNPTSEFNKKFFKNYEKKIVLFKPIKYTKKQGGSKTKNYRCKKRKSKSIKNRTRKNR
jgi:hypothetical protein